MKDTYNRAHTSIIIAGLLEPGVYLILSQSCSDRAELGSLLYVSTSAACNYKIKNEFIIIYINLKKTIFIIISTIKI